MGGGGGNPPNDLPAMPTVGRGLRNAKIPPPIAIYVYHATYRILDFYHDAAPKARRGTPRRYKDPLRRHDHAGITTGNGGLDRMRGRGRDGRGNLRENREDPAPTVGIAGRSLGGLPPPPPIYAPQTTTGTAWRRITTRHAASLRPPRNGRIGFKPPYSKRGTAKKKARMGSIFYGEGFPPLQ